MSTVTLYSLGARDIRTYAYAALFVAGNIVLPQLCHLIPQGGVTLLPIYFFTLIAAYKFGWRAGMLTAIASPLVNHWLFGMPGTSVLPIILIKSVLLALAASFAASRCRKVSLLSLLAVVLFYQTVGSAVECLMCGSIATGVQDFRLGLPGMLIQVLGGWLVLRLLCRG